MNQDDSSVEAKINFALRLYQAANKSPEERTSDEQAMLDSEDLQVKTVTFSVGSNGYYVCSEPNNQAGVYVKAEDFSALAERGKEAANTWLTCTNLLLEDRAKLRDEIKAMELASTTTKPDSDVEVVTFKFYKESTGGGFAVVDSDPSTNIANYNGSYVKLSDYERVKGLVDWVLEKIRVCHTDILRPNDEMPGKLYGAMHVLSSRAKMFENYLATRKNDVAELQAEISSLTQTNERLGKEVEVMKRTYTPRRQITLCGSMRFKKAWIEWNVRLSLEGIAVYSAACASYGVDVNLDDSDKRILDEVYKSKIDASDEIFVLDVGGYIGASTKSEIDHAIKTGKTVRYLSQEYPDWTEDDCEFAQDDPASLLFVNLDVGKRIEELGEENAKLKQQLSEANWVAVEMAKGVFMSGSAPSTSEWRGVCSTNKLAQIAAEYLRSLHLLEKHPERDWFRWKEVQA